MHTPQGICLDCKLRLLAWMSNKENPKRLRIAHGIELGKPRREVASAKCGCHICYLGNLQGAEFQKARAQFKKSQKEQEVEKGSDLRRCNQCFEAISMKNSDKHSCVGKRAMLANLKEAIPTETRMQLALDTLREFSGGSGDSTFTVQSIHGGKASTVSLGKPRPAPCSSIKLTHSEVQTLATDSHLNYGQVRGVMANLRAKFGRSFVESGLDKQLAVLNGRFLPYFTCTRTHFEKGGGMVEKPLFFCNSTVAFLMEVARLRGDEWEELVILVQGDSGQKWFKLSVSLIARVELEGNVGKKGRRTREVGIGGGVDHKSYGVRKMVILALVQGVPESSYNLDIIFRWLMENVKSTVG